MKVVHSYNLLILYKQYENVIEKKMLSNSQQPLKSVWTNANRDLF